MSYGKKKEEKGGLAALCAGGCFRQC